MIHAQAHPIHSNKEAQAIKAADIGRDPSDVPGPIGERAPAVVRVTLTTKELVGALEEWIQFSFEHLCTSGTETEASFL